MISSFLLPSVLSLKQPDSGASQPKNFNVLSGLDEAFLEAMIHSSANFRIEKLALEARKLSSKIALHLHFKTVQQLLKDSSSSNLNSSGNLISFQISAANLHSIKRKLPCSSCHMKTLMLG